MRPRFFRYSGTVILFLSVTKLASLASANAPPPPSTQLQNAANRLTHGSVMGESALIDKETGRIFWEGGSTSTLSASLSPFLEGLGVRHFRASVLSGILLLSLVSNVVAWIRGRFEESSFVREGTGSWFVKSLLLIINWTILRLPKLDNRFVLVVFLLYLVEATTCSTRRYLANAISSPAELESYIEKLRQEPPAVAWKVRCFHYERRRWLSMLLLVKLWKLLLKRSDDDNELFPSSGSSASLLTKKVVTHQAVGNYTFSSCQDNTVAGVWKRAEATAQSHAPFAKIIFSKMLVLSNAKAREDYFKQQGNFVSEHLTSDEYAEFSTSIQVAGFKPRMLALRPVEGHPSVKLFRLNLFWLFTFLGLTVPFRIWFARHCDEIRVTVTKETVTLENPSKGWFTRSSKRASSPQEHTLREGFKRMMQELSLYSSQQEALLSSSVELETKEEATTNATLTTENVSGSSSAAFVITAEADQAAEESVPEVTNATTTEPVPLEGNETMLDNQ